MIRQALPMLVVLVVLLLVGCDTTRPGVVYTPVEVKVPVPVPCRAALPAETPAVADDGQPRAAWTAAALAQRERLLAEAALLRAALASCGAPTGAAGNPAAPARP